MKKASLLQEWIIHFNTKKAWRHVSECAQLSILGARPITKSIITAISKHTSIRPSMAKDKDVLSKHLGIDISENDWKRLQTEIPRICSYAVKIMQMDENPIPSDLELQYYYMSNDMEKHLDMSKKKNEKQIIQAPVEHHYYGLYLTRFRELELFDRRNKNYRQGMTDLSQWEEAINMFHYENRLRVLTEIANRSGFSGNNQMTTEHQQWQASIPRQYIEQHPQVRYYHLVYGMISNESEHNFMQLLQELKKQDYSKITISYSHVLYQYLSAFCSRMIGKGHHKYHQYYVQVNQLMMEKGLLLEMGYIPPYKLENITKSALESGDLDWAEEFFQTHKIKLAKPVDNRLVTFCNALIQFYSKQYQKANAILSTLPHIKDDLSQMSSHYMLLLTYIILGDDDEAERLHSNLKTMVYRKKDSISPTYFEHLKTGLSYALRIMYPKDYNFRKHYESLLEELKAEDNFKDKNWLVMTLEKKLGKHIA